MHCHEWSGAYLFRLGSETWERLTLRQRDLPASRGLHPRLILDATRRLSVHRHPVELGNAGLGGALYHKETGVLRGCDYVRSRPRKGPRPSASHRLPALLYVGGIAEARYREKISLIRSLLRQYQVRIVTDTIAS